MPRGEAQLIHAEASFFADLVQSGRITLDEARADLGIDERTLTIWRDWLEWETWPRAMMSAAIRLRRKILERFEEMLELRVRETCQQLSSEAEAVELMESKICPTCQGERTIESKPAGAGHSDDLAEHEWCPDCGGSGKPEQQAGEQETQEENHGDTVHDLQTPA